MAESLKDQVDRVVSANAPQMARNLEESQRLSAVIVARWPHREHHPGIIAGAQAYWDRVGRGR